MFLLIFVNSTYHYENEFFSITINKFFTVVNEDKSKDCMMFCAKDFLYL
jgi:hypothetical protein